MQVTFITNIPQVGDTHCNKTLYELLTDVLPVGVYCGLVVNEVSYGYLKKFQCNAITLRLIEKDDAVISKDLVIAVFNKGDHVPVEVHNQSKNVYVNWGISFYNLGMFDVSEEHCIQ